MAARIVNKQRRQFSETKNEKRKDGEGRSPDRDLPVKNCQNETIAEIATGLGKLSGKGLRKLRSYEEKHKNRKKMLNRID